MNNNPYRGTKVKPKMLIKAIFQRTKNFLHKTFINLNSFSPLGYRKLPKSPPSNPVFPGDSKKSFRRSFSQQWDFSNEVFKEKEGFVLEKEQEERDENCSRTSMNVGDHSATVLEELKEEKKANKHCRAKREESSASLGANDLAEKMRELIEMMDLNSVDQLLDIEEVLHYYSQLTCPVYRKMVDKCFMNMYYEFNIPQTSTSVNSSMRNLGSVSVHSSMRTLSPIKI